MSESHEIINRLRRGDGAAFASLVQTHQAGLLRTAKTIVFTQADAEEVLQETWLAVLRGIQRFEGRSSLKTWIYQILTYRARSHRNYERRYVSFDQMLSPFREGQATSLLQKHSSVSADFQETCLTLAQTMREDHTPERICLSREILIQIEGALKILPPVQQRVFRLHYIEQRETTEICAMLNLSANNQRVILHRARQAMRRTLRAYYRKDSNDEHKAGVPRHARDTFRRTKRTIANGHGGYHMLKGHKN